jgi:hypothetical protein
MSGTLGNLRPELEALPPRIARLPVDGRGYPVPWFVAWENGAPEFRVADGEKWARAVRDRLCWVCGDPLGAYLVFVIGPMCGINRTTAEPPCHRECAEWSARNCPFLTRPQMVRREDEIVNNERHAKEGAGCPITRNPGVTLLWTTREYRVFSDGRGGRLIRIGSPRAVAWYAHGRPATREEVAESVRTGLPLLEELAIAQDRQEGAGAVSALHNAAREFERLYPVTTNDERHASV